jgi:trk system potassium uptake protein TrkA
MNIIVVGCGRVGSELAYRLYQKGHQVTVIDQIVSAFDNLHPDFRGRKLEGELLSREVLHRAGIEEADGLAAVTNSDSFNVVIAHLARTTYRVPRVVARNFDPRWRSLHEAFGLPVVSSSLWAAEQTEQLLCQARLPAVFSVGGGEVKVYQLTVPEGWQGRSLQELTDLIAESHCLAVALSRAGRGALPSPETSLEAGDLLYLSATAEGMEVLRERINLKPEE